MDWKSPKCLIVEPSEAFAKSAQSSLREIFGKEAVITVARKFKDAVLALEKEIPAVLVCEYEVEGKFGFELIEKQRAALEDSDRLSIVVTKNSQDSVVAEAAEESVDAFILKPFSPAEFQNRVKTALNLKANPSPYRQEVAKGRVAMAAGDLDLALSIFQKALPLNPAPSMAHFYAGEVYRLKKDFLQALSEYKNGCRHQKLHYRCLIGQFEVLIELQKFEDAFALVDVITTNFPLSPKRLIQIFMATVFSRKFERLMDQFLHFQKMENRTPELIRVASLGMFTGGKWYLTQKKSKEAIHHFDKAAMIQARDFIFLEKIVQEFMKVGVFEGAQVFLGKVPSEVRGSVDFERLQFKVERFIMPKFKLIELGKKLVAAGGADAEIFEILVRLCVEENKLTYAEDLIQRCSQVFPDLKIKLFGILNSAKTEPSAAA